MTTGILTVNGGSSSLKFAAFRAAADLERVLTGSFARIGTSDAELTAAEPASGHQHRRRLALPDHAACVPVLLELLSQMGDAPDVAAIGHRIVHGGERYRTPQRVDAEVLAELHRLTPFAPEHAPAELAVLEALGEHYPGVPQVVCFDTAFHADLPRVAQLLPIPRRYAARGVRRYGFHGISYTYLLQELDRVAGAAAARGRVLLAHLGNGASLAAVRDGRCIDTTMGFTPAAGLVMGTRTGDLDPGLVAYLARSDGMTAAEFDRLVNRESGLRGLSETTADVRELLAREAGDTRAAEALAVFCYQAKKWIGALGAALGGLDTLVFAGGIGEHAAPIRARICAGLEHLGIELDAARNDAHAPMISAPASRVAVRIIPTDEELLIARATRDLLSDSPPRPPSTPRKEN
jgi:acetate kinase